MPSIWNHKVRELTVIGNDDVAFSRTVTMLLAKVATAER
jgi:hypothetical protein